MKIINTILILIAINLLYSCGETTKKSNTDTKKIDNNSIEISLIDTNNADPQKNEQKNKLTKEERRKQIEELNRIDSLRLDFALKDAFEFAKNEFKNDNFIKQYEIQPDDSLFSIHIEIEISNLFNNGSKYFLLRRHVPWATYLNVYKIDEDQAKEVIVREQGGMTYIRDTIYDVNGDKLNDFLVHWYPSSGCCRRNVYNVYLNQENGNFTSDYEFINPTFSANEKVIRGVGYGHPGGVGLYKYKWNDHKIDTIEFIYLDTSKVNHFIKTNRREYYPTAENGKVLRGLPREYSNIESIDWFMKY